MKKISGAVEGLLRNLNLWQGYLQYSLVLNWPELVGTQLAAVTKAESISNGVIRVAVKDSVWSYHLTMMKPQLITKLNNFAGSRQVKDIHFFIANPEDS